MKDTTYTEAEDKTGIIAEYVKRHEMSTVIETGSARGWNAADLSTICDRVITIEIGDEEYRDTWRHCLAYPKVYPIKGDSAEVIVDIAARLEDPALWWLDAHWVGSGGRGPVDCPVHAELRHILGRGKRDVILIDDARLFGNLDGWPTIADTLTHIQRLAQVPVDVDIDWDVIRIVPT